MSSENKSTSIAQSRNLKKCPEKLESLIYTFNLLPPKEELWTLTIGSQKLFSDNHLHLQALQELKNKIENYSIEFQYYIYGREVDFLNPKFCLMTPLPDLEYWEIYEALKRYEDFIENGKLLSSMIRSYSSLSNKDTRQMPYLLQTKTRIRIDEKGRIQLSFDEFAEALQNVEISRIKICDNCSRIFWQGRNTQKGCSKKCGSNLRVLKSRELKRKKRTAYEFNEMQKHSIKNKSFS